MKIKRFFRESIIEFLQFSILEDKRILVVGENRNIGEDAGRFKPELFVELFHNDDQGGISSSKDNVRYIQGNLAEFKSNEIFDYVVFYESLNYEADLYQTFHKLRSLTHIDSKVFILEVNPFILFILELFKLLGLRTPKLERNMLRLGDLENLISIFGFETLDKGYRFAVPFKLFGLGCLINRILPRLRLLRHFCFGQYLVFRQPAQAKDKKTLSCSVVVPCHNEEGNISECISRIPDFGSWREIIVVNDGSTDKTEQIVRQIMEKRNDIKLITYEKNKGKGYAVNKGWQESKGDVLMMLDCDSTTPPEEMVLFHDAMENGAEFINGTRVIYPREKHSIPLLNRVGVTFFACLMGWIIQKRITDTFCGTKVFLKKNRKNFEIKEFLWGDWDLFFTAARYRMKMVELPVHYKTRKAGVTKMRPIKHGAILFLKAFEGLKVVK